jgi:hypothetical protein
MESPQACERKIGSDKKAQHQSTSKRSASQIGGRFLQRMNNAAATSAAFATHSTE